MAKVVTEEDGQDRLELARKVQRDVELDDLKFILSTKQGMRWFKRFFEKGKMFTTTFTGNSQGMFLEGHRNLALWAFHDICEADASKVPDLVIRDPEAAAGDSDRQE